MSLIEKLKDKINYKLFKALDDPEASTFAAEQAQQKADENAVEQKKLNQQEQKAKREKDLLDLEANKPAPPSKTVIEWIIKIVVYGLAGYLVAAYGSMAANTGIHRHPIIRILYFIFGSLAGLGLIILALPAPPLIVGIAVIHFVLSWLDLLPHNYNFLPLMQYEPTTNIFYKTFQEYIIAWDPSDPQNKEHYENKLKGYMAILGSALAAAPKAKEAPSKAE